MDVDDCAAARRSAREATARPKRRDNIPVPLAQRWESWQQDGLPTDIAATLEFGMTHMPAAAATVEALADDLQAHLERHPALQAVDRWLAQAQTWDDRLDRRATVATLERLSGFRPTPLDWPGWQPPKDTPRKRLLRPLELGLLRLHARTYDLQRVATVALLEAGATSGELPLVTPASIDGDTVQLPGKRGVKPRTVAVPEWSRRDIKELVGVVHDGQPLVYTGDSDDHDKRVSSILMNFQKPFTQSGLKADPTLAPMSVTYTGLRNTYEAEGWEACAHAAGVGNWQRLRTNIGLT